MKDLIPVDLILMALVLMCAVTVGYILGCKDGYNKAIDDVTVIIEKQINDEKDSN